MNTLYVIFWTMVIFSSIAWYGFLVFYIGAKGGKEIKELTRTLGTQSTEREEE